MGEKRQRAGWERQKLPEKGLRKFAFRRRRGKKLERSGEKLERFGEKLWRFGEPLR